ncbi:hypothetical protein ACWIG4_30255 [Streptomyces sp. NPDC002248]
MTICTICDEEIIIASEYDDEICAQCDDEAYEETNDELRAAGIDDDDTTMTEFTIISRILD